MKKIIGLALTAVIVIAVLGVGSFAYFSDAEKASGNSIIAGKLDLTPGGTGPNYTFVTDGNTVPVASATGATDANISLTNSGTVAGYLDIALTNVYLDATGFPTGLHYVDASNVIHSVTAGDLGVSGKVAIYLSTASNGTLANGTTGTPGVAYGAPISLNPGSTNTITVTTAGTFTVTLPAGTTGTASSGTATVTSTPVSLVAGNNTITTTTTGTFTISSTIPAYSILLTPGGASNWTNLGASPSLTYYNWVGSSGAYISTASTATSSNTTATTWTGVAIPNGTNSPASQMSTSGVVYLHVSRYIQHVADNTTNNGLQGEILYSDMIFTLRQQ